MPERLDTPKKREEARKLLAQLNGHDRDEFRKNWNNLAEGIEKAIKDGAAQIEQLGIFPTEKFEIYNWDAGKKEIVERPAIYVTDIAGSSYSEHFVIIQDGALIVKYQGRDGKDERVYGDFKKPSKDQVIFYANYAFTAMEEVIARSLGASTPQEVLNPAPNESVGSNVL